VGFYIFSRGGSLFVTHRKRKPRLAHTAQIINILPYRM
jgi:hypothetical protein